MVLLEMSIVPIGQGESVSSFVAQCVDIIDRSGLDYELHSMGTIVEGELDEVLTVMRLCIEHVAQAANRVSCTAKIDYRKGAAGGLRSKVDSVEQKLGRSIRR
ncbi:MAG: MTH1187 family thiamine-binding protein [Pirellulales bacterium]|nr:MTH1187 family thiamine-binding protein [Pirellulales bacterium]